MIRIRVQADIEKPLHGFRRGQLLQMKIKNCLRTLTRITNSKKKYFHLIHILYIDMTLIKTCPPLQGRVTHQMRIEQRVADKNYTSTYK